MYSGRSTLSTFSTLNSNKQKNRCIPGLFFIWDAIKIRGIENFNDVEIVVDQQIIVKYNEQLLFG